MIDRRDRRRGRNLPDAAKPWAYGWWVHGNVSEQAIRRDSTQAKRKEIGGHVGFRDGPPLFG